MSFQELKNHSNLAELLGFDDRPDDELERIYNKRDRTIPREGIECDKCGNHEFVWVVKDGERMTHECECKTARDNLHRLRASGLSEQVAKCTFETYKTQHDWQKAAKDIVLRFVSDKRHKWLLLSGQPGSGKTHLCTAAAGEFIRAGADTRYICWVDESTALKAHITNDQEYSRRIEPLKTCQVLYIDDFWKTQHGQQPTSADVRLAFDLLNYRYRNSGLVTMISTERTVKEMLAIDQGVGSRIYEMTKGYRLEFVGIEKNWRLSNG